MIELAIGSAALAATAVTDGREWPRWGMRPAEVAGVVRGATPLPTSADASALRPRVRATSKWMGDVFTADYLFDQSGGLTAVRLALRNPSRCEALYGALLSRFGLPYEANRPLQNDAWTDRRTGDRVTIVDARRDPQVRSCVVTISQAGGIGLINP